MISLLSKGALKSILQHQSSKTSILRCSAFFMVQLTSVHDYWKNIVLTIQTFVGKVMSLLFNMLSRLVIAFLTRNKRLLISWPQSPAAMLLGTKKKKSVTVYIFSLSICYEVMGPDGT